ncbi:MAG: hypothetical protein JST01_25460 [Cyanobacteria bacterium SZAS TMP-1]|nr:hypothetical protein [Cyanobacteria bacterium SZAS TMP-1]
MKVGNFIIHTLIFLAAWCVLAAGSWGFAQAFSMSTLMPWFLPLGSLSPATMAFALGAAVAVLGSFMAALVLLVVLIALEALWHYCRSHFPQPKN